MGSHVIPDVPYIFQGLVPRCHVTSLRMILEYYGSRFAPSYLMNLSGFNYGFKYFKESRLAAACAESPFGPWMFMAYASEKVGCKVDTVSNMPWEDTWELLKTYVAKDVPVYMPLLNMQHLWETPHPVPHLVVVCGYDEEKGVVMVHDPALGQGGEGIPYLPPNGLPSRKSGAYAEFRIEDFRAACNLADTPWQSFGKNGLCVIHPPSRPPEVPWPDVLQRNAKLTLGQFEEAIGQEACSNEAFGPDGILELADDFQRCFGLLEERSQLMAVLGRLRTMTFIIGSSYRNDAHSFLAGFATATGSKELERASTHLRTCGEYYEQGLTQIDYVMQQDRISPEDLSATLWRVAKVLRQAAGCERKAGESMLNGGSALRFVPDR